MEDDSARGRNMKGGNEERLHLRPDVQTEVTPEDRETQPNKPFPVIPAGPHAAGWGQRC